MRGVYAGVGRIAPRRTLFQRPHALALVRRQNRELDPVLSQQLQRFGVGCGFRQPHALGGLAVVAFVVGDAPANLRDAVAAARQRHNHVVVDLRHGRAVAAKTLAAAQLALQHHAVGAGRILLQPTQQRGPEVEVDARVVVQDARNLVLAVHHPRRAVGGVALRANALVPVVVGRGRVLGFHCFQPGVLARRLVKVPVNADKAFARGHQAPIGLWQKPGLERARRGALWVPCRKSRNTKRGFTGCGKRLGFGRNSRKTPLRA